MAFDFPYPPTEGQIFTPPGGPTYTYKAPVWLQPGSDAMPVKGPITLTGADPLARIGFTGADIGFGAKVAGNPAGSVNRWVWNDKPDLTGTDVMTLNDNGIIQLFPSGAGAIHARSQSSDLAAHTLNIGALGAGTPNVPVPGAQMGLRGYDFNGSNPGGIDFYGADAAGALSVLGSWARDGTLSAGVYKSNGPNLLLGNNGTTGAVYLRPNGVGSTVGQMYVTSNGDMVTDGAGTFAGLIASTTGQLVTRAPNGGNAHVVCQNYLSQTAGYFYCDLVTQVMRITNNIASGTGQFYVDRSGNMTINGAVGTKASGTAWANPSDERIKEVVGDYETGLAEIIQLQPRRYVYKGNDTFGGPPGTDFANPDAPRAVPATTAPYEDSPHYQMAVDGTEVAGFVAQEVEVVMPAMVTQTTAYIDGAEVTDFRTLDTTNLTLALVNAIKELAARVEALEAA